MIVAAPLTIVGSVDGGIPVLSVHGANLTLRAVVLVEDVGVVELAKSGRPGSIITRVVDVVLRSSLTDRGATLGIKGGVVV